MSRGGVDLSASTLGGINTFSILLFLAHTIQTISEPSFRAIIIEKSFYVRFKPSTNILQVKKGLD